MQTEKQVSESGAGEPRVPGFLEPQNVELARTVARELGIDASFSGTFVEMLAGGYTVAREISMLAPTSQCVRLGIPPKGVPRHTELPGVEVVTRTISIPRKSQSGSGRASHELEVPISITSGNFRVESLRSARWLFPSFIDKLTGAIRPRHIYFCPAYQTPVEGNSTERMRQRNYFDSISEALGFASPLRMREWVQAGVAVQLLGQGERAAMLVRERALSLSLGMQDRQSFVEKGYVERVVQLARPFSPEHLEEADEMGGGDSYRGAEYLVLLSTGNTSVAFSRGGVERSFPLDEMDARDWSLLPSDYLDRESSPRRHTVFLGDIAAIKRGRLTQKGFAEMTDDRVDARPLHGFEMIGGIGSHSNYDPLGLRTGHPGFVYVSSTNFEDGEIVRITPPLDSGLMSATAGRTCQIQLCTYRKGCGAGEERGSFVEAPCLLVSRVPKAVDGSQRFTVCLVDVPKEMKVAAAESVLAISLDRSGYDPVFLMAFLRSEQGQDLLMRAATGTSVIRLSTTNLARMRVPKCSPELQEDISSRYMRSWHEKDTLEMARLSIERAGSSLFGQGASVYEDGYEREPLDTDESRKLSLWTRLYPDTGPAFRFEGVDVSPTLDENGQSTEETERLVLENYARMVWREDHLLFGLLGIDGRGCIKLIRDALEDRGDGATCSPDNAGPNGPSDGTEGLSESDIDKVMDEAYENFLTDCSSRASISAMRKAAVEAIRSSAIGLLKQDA